MEKVIANNYGSFEVVFHRGEGSRLYDVDGKEYIDFVSGIGVNCLGHNHPALVKAVQEQAARQIHISNYYNSDQGLAFAQELLAATGMERVYFGNSGAEANEAAIKLARKYGWLKSQAEGSGKPRNMIVTLEKSFHGRTLATLRATGQEKFHVPAFEPYPAGFRHIPAGDYSALDSAFDETVCALMIECVQGEGGVNLIAPDWAQAAATATRKSGAIVICDEVQTGMGRTGSLLASEALGIQPEIVTLAKGIAGGIPMGACLWRGGLRDVFVAGDHQSTFGGNPLACAAGRAVLSQLTSAGFLQRVIQAGEAIRGQVASWNLPCIREVRGKGLMIGIDVEQSAAQVQKDCLAAGLCISTAGANTLRFLPPLVITDEEINRGLDILKNILFS
ncbi:MAG: acetylornithine/succinylornithine family transaminase [Spirochaetaceae bacterium]|nr:acetylornithine/succinylornithine family transaminase [Spirochaetaceae bacterium]